MKKLGLIGGTGPTSTLLYYKGITSIVQKKTGNLPNLNIESLSAFDIMQFSNERNYNQLAEYLLNSFKILRTAGCDIGALTGLTPHIVLPKIRELSPIPIVSIIDTTVEYAISNKTRNVGLLGTIPTMKGNFLKEVLNEKGIEVTTPKDDEMFVIQRIIEKELEFGIVNGESQEEFFKIIKRMQNENKIDSVILGSTEMSILFKKYHPELPLIDAMQIHVKKLAEMIIN